MSVEPETGLVIADTITAGNTGDGGVATELLADEDDPVEVLADAAYGGGHTRADLDDARHTTVIKPAPLRPGGARRVRPRRLRHRPRQPHRDLPQQPVRGDLGQGNAAFGARCRTCPLRDRCTTSRSGRSLHISEHDRYLVDARRQAKTPEFQQTYRRWRPMVERSIAWLMRDGHRRCRYRGVARNRLGLSLRVAAVNLQRLLALGLEYNGGWKIA